MAWDAHRHLVSFFARRFLKFQRKTELLAYLFLCVSKMPFIPPVSLTGSGSKMEKAGPSKDGTSVKERLASNLKQLGKKSPPRSHLPTAARGLPETRKKGPLPRRPPESLPASSSGESLSKTRQTRPVTARIKARPEETRFTLTLTPEAVLLLQRRNNNNNNISGSFPDSRRARRGQYPAPSPSLRPHCRAGAPARTRCDVSSMVKVSLLNERHRYDDVEYEDDGERGTGVDERVVLKCTEWLRGLDNTPVTVAHRKTTSVKSF
nr:proline-rich protein 18-like [Nerophis lumbriciformis]